MTKAKKIIRNIIIMVGVVILLVFLGSRIQQNKILRTEFTDKVNPYEQTLEEILYNSKKITMKKRLFSFRKHYYILSDGVLIGEVTGKLFPVFGDILKLKDVNGAVIKEESQIKRLGFTQEKLFNISINRLGKVEDSNGNTTGYIGEEKLKDFWKLKHILYFYDENYNKLGKGIEENLFFNKDYNILDNNKNVDYIIDGKHFSLTDDTTIEIIDSSDIPIEDAIFYTIIEKSISSSKTKSSSSNSGKSNKK